MGRPASIVIRGSTLALALLVSAPTLARPDVDREVAAALDAASAHFRAARYAEALDALQRVEPRVGDDPSVRWNIARCLEELGRIDDAIAAFDRFAQVAKTPDERRAAGARVADLRARWLGALVVVCEAGTVSLTEPRAIPARPCPAHFDSVRPGQVWGQVMAVDGVVPFETTVRSQETTRIVVRAEVPPTPDASHSADGAWWPIIAAGASVAVGAGLMWATHGAADDARRASDRADRASYDDAGARLETLRALGYTAYGLGAALAGVQLWFWARDDAGSAAPERAGVGLSWGGRF